MAEERLSGSDKRILLLWIVCGIIGALFAHRYYFRAFPEASVDFKVSRTAAQSKAKQFVESLGENLGGYQSTIEFDLDDNAKTYLERELGLQQANLLMASEVNIWYWRVRFFRPQQEEEFKVRVNPAGQVVGYEHKIPEAQAGKSLDRDAALADAEKFAQGKLGANLSQWNFLPSEANSQARPNRMDWSFTWERKDFKAKDAPYRFQVEIQGDQIGGSQEYLQIPELWIRSYEHLRSTNDLYEEIALVPYGFVLGAALWLGVVLWRQGKTSWITALKIGGFVTVLYFLMELNEWGSARAAYDTQSTYGGFVLQKLFLMLLAAVGTAFTISLVYPAGEPLYRESQPPRLRLPKAFTPRGIRSKEFFCASLVGICLAAIHIGFIVAFYMIGSRHGVWAPQDTNYSDIVNTPFPWIAGVAIGVLAATNEEFTFRLFAIPFFRKLTGSSVLAVILPAFFWSFLHSNYPQEPGYIRGIEIGIMGIAAGLVYLRWGIVSTLIWHYTVDASLVGLLLIRSDNLYFKVSGLIVGLAAVVPLAISGCLYWMRGHFEDVADLLNEADPAPRITLGRPVKTVEPVEAPGRRYSPLTLGALGALLACVVVGGLVALRLKRDHIGDYLRVSADRTQAIQLADAAMKANGLDPRSYKITAVMVDISDPVVNEFLYRRMPVKQINLIYSQLVPGALWKVRYFRDSQPEEFRVTLKPDGSFHGFWHILAEATKGADLTKEDAIAIAKKYLTDQKKMDLSGWKLVSADSIKRPNRTDHALIWQQDQPLDPQRSTTDSSDHAYARIALKVLGSEPADYQTYIKIPDEFARQQGEQTVGRILIYIGRICLGLGLVTTVLVLFFKRLRAQPGVKVPWKRLFRWGFIGFCGFATNLLFGAAIPELLDQYLTSLPFGIYLATRIVAFLLAGALSLSFIALLFGLAWSFAARRFGEVNLPEWFGMPAEYYRDAFSIGIAGTMLLAGLRHAIDYASAWWPALHRGIESTFGSSFDAIYPGLGLVGGAVSRGLLVTGTIALAAAFVAAEIGNRWLRLALFVAVSAGLVTSWGSPGDFLKQFLASAILLGVVVLGIKHVVKWNLLGLFLVVVSTALLGGAVELVSQPNAFYKANGYGILAALAVLFLWPLVTWIRGRGEPHAHGVRDDAKAFSSI